MNRFFLAFILAAISILALSCGQGNSPKGVTAESIECLQNKDYKGYVDLMLIEKDGTPIPDADKEKFVDIIKQKCESGIEKKGGIKDYEILGEEINEEEGTAIVKTKITCGDGDTEESETNLKLDENKNWKIYCKK